MKKLKSLTLVLLAAVMVAAASVFIAGCTGGKSDKCTVTYVYDNGQENLVSEVEKGDCAIQVKDPVKEGASFEGWYLGDTLYDFTTPVTSNITLTAHWGEGGNPSQPTDKVIVSWREQDSVVFVFEDSKPSYVNKGATVSFKIRVSPYYNGSPVVKAGAQVLSAKDGVYSFAANSSVTVTVEGLTADNSPIEGKGTQQSPFTIKNAAQLKRLADAVNDPTNDVYNEAFIRLDADLDMNGFELQTMGDTLNANHFSGEFNGAGHTVSNFKLVSGSTVYGFIGYLVLGKVENLNLKNFTVDAQYKAGQNFIAGAIAGYDMGGDIFNCSAQGEVSVALTSGDYSYVGGICGFMQGYSTDYSGTISYSSSKVNITSNGSYSNYATGGIVGAAVGTAPSAPAVIFNCVYTGEIIGDNTLSGGIVGYLRNYSSVANCYTGGTIRARGSGSTSAAGSVIGLADNETALTSSYSVMNTSISGTVNSSDLIKGDVVGKRFVKAYSGIDAREALILNSYQAEGGKINGVDITVKQNVLKLLGWNGAEWNFEKGIPQIIAEGAQDITFKVSFNFSGESVTLEDNEGNPLKQTTDEINITGGYIPLYWVYEADGRNSFVADSGKVSYGFFFDAACTKRVPSAMMLTGDVTIYAGFADYGEVAGEYYAHIGNTELEIVLNELGKATLIDGGKVTNCMFVYDGQNTFISNAYFAKLLNSDYKNTDYYAYIDGSTLYIYDDAYFTEENNNVIAAYAKTAATGKWYNAQGDIYEFFAGGSGTVTYKNGTEADISYICTGNTVEINFGGSKTTATISQDGKKMTTADGTTLSVDKFDVFAGLWESAYNNYFTVYFDGMGKATYKNAEYSYTVTGDKLTFNGVTAYFNDGGLLVFENDGNKTIMGKEGSYIGAWTDTGIDYTMVLGGISKDGYGYGQDTNGFTFTYNTEKVDGGLLLNMWVGTSWYGYGGIGKFKDSDDEMLLCAIYTPASGMLVDDYNLCYHDGVEGSWNGSDGTVIDFNGFGAYDFYKPLYDGSVWQAKGQATVSIANGALETVNYTYDNLKGEATFTYNSTVYTVKINGEGLILTDGSNEVNLLAPDYLAGSKFVSQGKLLTFNGKSNVGLGKATLNDGNGKEVYDYAINPDGSVVLSQNGITVFTAEADGQTNLFALTAVNGEKTLYGYYSPMVGIDWLGPNGITLKIDGYFDLDGISYGTFNGVEVAYGLLDENTVQLIYRGSTLYYLVWQTQDVVALYDSNLRFINVLTVSDGFEGTYTANDGSTITLDGRSKASEYVYASATLTLNVNGKTERYSFVYEIESGVIVIYEIDRSNSQPVLTEKYRAYTSAVEGATEYSNGSVTIWLKAVED